MRRYRSLSAVVSAIAVFRLVGGLLGRRARRDRRQGARSLQRFTAALSAIETNYVEKVDSDRLVYGAIRGMLSTLDPHSSFYDPKEYARMRERQEGHYYGIGISKSGRSTTTSSRRRCSRARRRPRPACVRATCSPRIAGEDTKGWTARAGRLHRARDEEASRDARHASPDFAAPPRLQGTDPDRARARRDQHADDSGVFHDRPDHGLRAASATSARPPIAICGARSSAVAPGHAAACCSTSATTRAARSIRPSRSPTEFMPRGKMIVYTRGRIAELRSGLPRDRRQRVHRHSDRADGEPQQRERVGNRDGRAAGSRSRVRRRRDDVRQGARAVGVSHQRRRRPGADDGALLHAERPADSAAVGRELRRIPHLHDARSGRQQAAQRRAT